MSAGFVHRSSYMTLSTDRCLSTVTTSELCFCLSLRDSDSCFNIDKASIKSLWGNYPEYPNLYLQLNDKEQLRLERFYWILYCLPTWKGCLTPLSTLNTRSLPRRHPVLILKIRWLFPFSSLPKNSYTIKEDGDTSAIYSLQGKLHSKAS